MSDNIENNEEKKEKFVANAQEVIDMVNRYNSGLHAQEESVEDYVNFHDKQKKVKVSKKKQVEKKVSKSKFKALAVAGLAACYVVGSVSGHVNDGKENICHEMRMNSSALARHDENYSGGDYLNQVMIDSRTHQVVDNEEWVKTCLVNNLRDEGWSYDEIYIAMSYGLGYRSDCLDALDSSTFLGRIGTALKASTISGMENLEAEREQAIEDEVDEKGVSR